MKNKTPSKKQLQQCCQQLNDALLQLMASAQLSRCIRDTEVLDAASKAIDCYRAMTATVD